MFYCCWNTSYCDYPCQQAHWPKHMATCTQNSTNVSGAGAGSGQESSEADSTVNEQVCSVQPTSVFLSALIEEYRQENYYCIDMPPPESLLFVIRRKSEVFNEDKF